MSHMDTSKTAKGNVLKQARYVALTDRVQIIISKSLEKRLQNGDIMDEVYLSEMWQSSSVSVSPSAASISAFTTLLPQCTPYLSPVPTTLPTTSTNPSLPHPPDVPIICIHSCKVSPSTLASRPSSPQVPSRAPPEIQSTMSREPLRRCRPPGYRPAC